MDKDKVQYLKAGYSVYIIKPIRKQELVIAIKNSIKLLDI